MPLKELCRFPVGGKISKLFGILEHGTTTRISTRESNAHSLTRNFRYPSDLQEGTAEVSGWGMDLFSSSTLIPRNLLFLQLAEKDLK